jgi:hypothetical protein
LKIIILNHKVAKKSLAMHHFDANQSPGWRGRTFQAESSGLNWLVLLARKKIAENMKAPYATTRSLSHHQVSQKPPFLLRSRRFSEINGKQLALNYNY